MNPRTGAADKGAKPRLTTSVVADQLKLPVCSAGSGGGERYRDIRIREGIIVNGAPPNDGSDSSTICQATDLVTSILGHDFRADMIDVESAANRFAGIAGIARE
jgi:hypothetical protein